MKNVELDARLKSARMPERPADYWVEFPQQVVRRLRRLEEPVAALGPRRSPLPIWGLGLAAVCLVIGFGIGSWHGRRKSPELASASESATLIREVGALFPNRVRAIVSDSSGVRLVLSDRPDVPASTPLWIKVCSGRQCETAITFSGQEIQVADRRIEVLADARGHILLVGNRWAWSTADSTCRAADLLIEAQVLERAL